MEREALPIKAIVLDQKFGQDSSGNMLMDGTDVLKVRTVCFSQTLAFVLLLCFFVHNL